MILAWESNITVSIKHLKCPNSTLFHKYRMNEMKQDKTMKTGLKSAIGLPYYQQVIISFSSKVVGASRCI